MITNSNVYDALNEMLLLESTDFAFNKGEVIQVWLNDKPKLFLVKNYDEEGIELFDYRTTVKLPASTITRVVKDTNGMQVLIIKKRMTNKIIKALRG